MPSINAPATDGTLPRQVRWRASTISFFHWEKLNRGVSKPGCFPLFSGKVQIVSRTLSGLFLVGALKRPRKRKVTNRENPRTIPEQIGKIPEKSGKSQKGQKRTKKERQVQIGKPPRLKHPCLAALGLRVTSRKLKHTLAQRRTRRSHVYWGVPFSVLLLSASTLSMNVGRGKVGSWGFFRCSNSIALHPP